jgi:hypothetical protein
MGASISKMRRIKWKLHNELACKSQRRRGHLRDLTFSGVDILDGWMSFVKSGRQSSSSSPTVRSTRVAALDMLVFVCFEIRKF